MVSITLSVLGGFLYAIAPAFLNSKAALASVALGRILGGLGRANSALGFAYVARACPANERTSITAILGGVQMIGMAIAPLFSACLIDVDFSFGGVHFDNLNSVGEQFLYFSNSVDVIFSTHFQIRFAVSNHQSIFPSGGVPFPSRFANGG